MVSKNKIKYDDVLRHVSFLQRPQQVLAVFKKSAKNSSKAENNDEEIPTDDYYKNLPINSKKTLLFMLKLSICFPVKKKLCTFANT